MTFFRTILRPLGSLIILGFFLLGLVGHVGHRHETPGHSVMQTTCDYCQVSQNFNQVDLPQSQAAAFSSPFVLVLASKQNLSVVPFELQQFNIRGPPELS